MRPTTPRTPAPHGGARRRALSLAALGAAAALSLSACGASGEDASAAWDAARTQLQDASSVRLTTEARNDSGAAPGTPDGVEIAGDVHSSDLSYTGVFRTDGYITRDESRTVGGQRYERFTLEQSGGVSGEGRPAFAEKWKKAEPLPGDASMRSILDGVLTAVPQAGALQGADVRATDIRRQGRDATRYVLDTPVKGGTTDSSLTAFTVADDDGTLLTVETTGPGTRGTVTFSDWNAVEPVTAPAAEDMAQDTATAK
ncbi:hypothetical protein MHY29_08420 [Micrococcus sp. ACRRV]|uniref:hypothetical protein n=1 Tax=Micrococcus sp. ACRRV TaxID=2918203 RepID=UPI001EF35605|nr:hypothetical protein [Micrococcus sp. ACRRV]MCG7422838.1 hypothetical protein [Micrococcus sp. ACRRV]